MDLYFFARTMLRYRFVAAAILLASAVASGVLCLTLTKRYTSGFTLLSPDGGGNAFLKSLGKSEYNSGMKSWVIPAVIRREDFVADVLGRRFTVWDNGLPVRMSVASAVGAPSRESLLENASRYLDVTVDEMYGSVRVAVETPHPELSFRAAEYALERLEAYARRTRLELEAESREYYDARIDEAYNALLLAESDLGTFMENNRGWAESDEPGVRLELKRLQRRQEIYSGISFELHKQKEIDGLKAMSMVPPLELLDRPAIPTIKSFPPRKTVLTAGCISGFVLSVACAFVLEALRRRAWGSR
jgi:hypothetical protein